MADTETAEPDAPETASVTEEQDDDTLQSDTEQGEEGEGEVAQDDEFEEIEHAGAKHRIPKALKDAFLMQSDYTRKTQQVAEERRTIASEREAFTREMEAVRKSELEVGRLAVMNDTLEQYQKVDWATYRAQNPEAAAQSFQDYTLLKDNRDRLAEKVKGEVAKRTEESQQSWAKRYAETNASLADPQKGIPGWNQALADKLRDFAIANGYVETQDDLRALAANARQVKLLHQAWLGNQLVEKQRLAAAKASKVVKEPEAEVKPLTEVKRRPSGITKPGIHDGLPIEEWVRRERARLQRKSA